MSPMTAFSLPAARDSVRDSQVTRDRLARMLWHTLVFALLMMTGIATCQADTVWMKNGDRLSGTIKSLEGGKLLLTTPYGGDVRIAFDQVATLQSEIELVINDQALRRDYLAKFARAQSGEVTLIGVQREPGDTQSEIEKSIPLEEVTRVVRPKPLIRDTTLTGTFDLGLNRKSASTDSLDYNAALRGEARHGLWRHQLSANHNRQKENNNVTTNTYGANYSLDRFLTEKAFWQGRIMHKRDLLEDLNRQTAYGTGPGYQFWDDELGALSLTVLAGRVQYGYSDGTVDNFYATSLRWDYNRYFRARQFEIFARGEFTRPLDKAANFGLNAEVGARYNMNQWASLYVKASRNQISGSRETLNENLLSTGVGLKW